jgi:hypothetical protein
MSEKMGQNPWKQSIQCWNCGGDHMRRDCPQRGDKVMTAHSVQQDMTVEDMGGNVPKIYATLDNKLVEFQSHMFEVKGNINNQPIVVFIDSRASHSYLDPNMVERLHLLRRNIGKPWSV